MNFGLVPAQCISSMGGNWVTSRKKIGAIENVLTIRNTYTTAEDCSGNNYWSEQCSLELSLIPIQCMEGNWVTSRTCCKKIGARTNVLTIRNTYKSDVNCSGNNHESEK